MFVCIYPGVHHVSEQVIHDVSQCLCGHHSVQRAHKHRLVGVQSLGGLAHKVTVTQHPGDDLDLPTERYKVTVTQT